MGGDRTATGTGRMAEFGPGSDLIGNRHRPRSASPPPPVCLVKCSLIGFDPMKTLLTGDKVKGDDPLKDYVR
jgi:hypothetical protein